MNYRSRILPSFLFPFFAFLVVTFGGSAFASLGLVGVEITSTEASPTSAFPIPIEFTFDDDVINFDQSDIMTTNGTLSNFVAVSTTVFTVDVTPTAKGAVEIELLEGAAQRQSIPTDDSEAKLFSILFNPLSVPDLRIGSKSNPGSHSGDNVYRPVPYTKKNLGKKAKFYVSFQNDGVLTDTFAAKSRKNKSFDTTFRAIGGGGNITAKITTGRYLITLNPEQTKNVRVCVKPVRKRSSQQTCKDLIKLSSTRSSAVDKCKITLQFKATPGIVPGAVGGSPLP